MAANITKNMDLEMFTTLVFDYIELVYVSGHVRVISFLSYWANT